MIPNPINWLLDKWHRHRRAIDLSYLWPECLEKAPDLDHALVAFSIHVFRDPAWTCLGPKEIIHQLTNLRKATQKMEHYKKIVEALENDLNTPLAITRLNALAKQIMAEKDPQKRWELQVQLLAGLKLLGLGPHV